MRKICLVIVLCLLILCSTACGQDGHFVNGGTALFESSKEMLNHMEGTWFAEVDYMQKNFYIFQDGQIYMLSDDMFAEEVERILSSALRNGGVNTWPYQDLAQVSKKIELENCSTLKNREATFLPEKGEIVFNEGTRIVITADSVCLKLGNEEKEAVMTKVSDVADFSDAYLVKLFNKTKKNYKAPKSMFFPPIDTYVDSLKTFYPGIDSYDLVSQGKDTLMYSIDGKVVDSDSTLIIGKDSVLFAIGKPTKDYGSPFLIEYSPDSVGTDLLIRDFHPENLSSLLKLAEPILKRFPDALSISQLESLFEEEKTADGNVYSFSTTVNGISYIITQRKNGYENRIMITMPDYLQMPETKETNNSSVPDNTGSTNSSVSNNSDNSNTGSIDATESSSSSETVIPDTNLTQVLDCNKVWKVDFIADGMFGTFHYVFGTDGSCYVVLSDGLSPWGGGIGTYTLTENTLKFSVSIDGGGFEYSYDYNPETNKLTHISGTPVFAGLAKTGDEYLLEEDLSNDVEKIKRMAQSYHDNYDELDGI